MNSIMVIRPYKLKHVDMWVFDDKRVGLVQEAFIAGADKMIDVVVKDIPNAEDGFTLIFSATPFPGYQYRMDWHCAEDGGGDWYHSEELKMTGWLCPALLLYFKEAPPQIYVQAKARG
jgi:hypothetical protein